MRIKEKTYIVEFTGPDDPLNPLNWSIRKSVFASSPLGIVGGAMADMWSASHRAAATAGFALATFVGPAMGPIVGGFITQSYLGWRWTEHITYIMAFFFLTIDVLFLPETYGPVLLKQKAKKLRHERQIWAIHARQEEKEI